MCVCATPGCVFANSGCAQIWVGDDESGIFSALVVNDFGIVDKNRKAWGTINNGSVHVVQIASAIECGPICDLLGLKPAQKGDEQEEDGALGTEM